VRVAAYDRCVMAAAPVMHICALRALEAGRRIRTLVQGMPLAERAGRVDAVLKPGAALTLQVDRAAEDVGLACFEQLAAEIGYRVHLIADAVKGEVIELGTASRRQVVFAHLDAVDGTIKVGGLGNDLPAGKVRVAGDGNWGVAAAFTEPTERPLDALRFGDFVAAVVVDGNPLRYRAHPEEVVAVPGDGGTIAYDVGNAPAVSAALRRAPRVYTSTTATLGQSTVYYDGFQAFDLDTRRPGDDVIAAKLYGLLINRHEGGAFDITRQYGNLSALLHALLGWRGDLPWMESQGAGFVVVNENMPNLIPAMPIVAGAGGFSVDFDGRPMAEHRLVDGRRSVVHAANTAMRDALLALVARARRA
jgi:hypothetical protein